MVAPSNGPEDGNKGEDGEGFWVLFEDGSLRFVSHLGHHQSLGGQEIETNPDGRRFLKLDRRVPIQPLKKRVEVQAETLCWPDAPQFEARQWKARPWQKNISAFAAGIVLLRHRLHKPSEIESQLADIHDLIRGGHCDIAIERVRQFAEDFPDHKPRAHALLSLAYHDRGDTAQANHFHRLAWLAGVPHPAMQEMYGDPIIVPDTSPDLWDDEGTPS
jgi:hypothetical protein